MTSLQELPEEVRQLRAIAALEEKGLDATDLKMGLAYRWLGMALARVPTETPKQFVKRRPGRGGKSYSYVEVGYMVQALNSTFGPFWDFTKVGEARYLTEEMHQTDGRLGIIVVQGRLTVKVLSPHGWLEIVKEAAGESEIQRLKETGKAVNIGDDEKAAESDALKRCASRFGIAADVYWDKDDLAQYLAY